MEGEWTVFKRKLLFFSTTGLILVNGHHHLLLREGRPRLAEKFLTENGSARGAGLSGSKGIRQCKTCLKAKCTEPSCDL